MNTVSVIVFFSSSQRWDDIEWCLFSGVLTLFMSLFVCVSVSIPLAIFFHPRIFTRCLYLCIWSKLNCFSRTYNFPFRDFNSYLTVIYSRAHTFTCQTERLDIDNVICFLLWFASANSIITSHQCSSSLPFHLVVLSHIQITNMKQFTFFLRCLCPYHLFITFNIVLLRCGSNVFSLSLIVQIIIFVVVCLVTIRFTFSLSPILYINCEWVM